MIHENYKQTSIPENDIALIYLSQAVKARKFIFNKILAYYYYFFFFVETKHKSIVLPHHGDISHFINVNFISWIQFRKFFNFLLILLDIRFFF